MNAGGTAPWDLHDCAPAPPQRQLLEAVLAPQARALDAWRQWRAAVDIDAVESASFRLLPLVYLRLKDLDPADPLLPRLRVIYRHTWFKNQLLFDRARQVLQRLGDAGISAMLLKGGAMALGHYRDPGARYMYDLDILVPPGDFSHAAQLLLAAGWTLPGGAAWRLRIARRLGFVHGATFAREGAELDLHAQLVRFAWQDDSRVWRGARQQPWRDLQVLLPSPTVALYHCCVHGLRWSYATLTWVVDAMVLLAQDAVRIDWSLLLKLGEEGRTLCALHNALAYLAAEWEAPVPAEVLERLAAAPVSDVERREYAVLASRPSRHPVHRARRLWLRSCRFRQGGAPPAGPIRASALGWISYLALYNLARYE